MNSPTQKSLDSLVEFFRYQKLRAPEVRFKGFWNSRNAEPSPCVTIYKRPDQTKGATE